MPVLSPLTETPARFLFKETVLGKYDAHYYLDESISYIFADSPSWLEEAYSSAISITDTGILMRNNENVSRVSSILRKGIIDFEKGVDIGGGYGLFVRGMRDSGYDFFWQDRYADNIVARGFEAGEGSYDFAVAFEVLEHLENPIAFLEEMLVKYQFHTCLITATVFDPDAIPDRSWWYWSFESGQHISFFSERALKAIAERLNMALFHLGGDLYAFSTLDLSALAERTGLLGRLRLKRRRPPSLTFSDHQLMVERLRKSL